MRSGLEYFEEARKELGLSEQLVEQLLDYWPVDEKEYSMEYNFERGIEDLKLRIEIMSEQ